ncbi:hypothetical protein [Streptomyces caelestis]|uniref:hypothetical protein n=1 Tax=Streptomyces caelestis TaxID=36816 RepID=UPI003650C949
MSEVPPEAVPEESVPLEAPSALLPPAAVPVAPASVTPVEPPDAVSLVAVEPVGLGVALVLAVGEDGVAVSPEKPSAFRT